MNPDNASDRRLFLCGVFASAAAAALCGCSGGSDEQAPVGLDSAPSPPNTAAPATPAPTPGPAPAPAPSPSTPPPAPTDAFMWQIAPDQTLALLPGTITTIATGAMGMVATVSPELPAGRTLSVTPAGHVIITAAPNAPVIDVSGPWRVDVASA